LYFHIYTFCVDIFYDKILWRIAYEAQNETKGKVFIVS
jgi:hypothetical protein